MRFQALVPLFLLAACSATTTALTPQDEPPGHSNRLTILLGQRSLEEADYAPVEDQPTLGIEYAHEAPDSLLGFELGLAGSYDEEDPFGISIKGSTGEVYGGVRKTFLDGPVRPFLAGGVSLITSQVEVFSVSESDSAVAPYVHGGVLFEVTRSFFLGLDARFLFASSMTIAGVDTDADYGQFALLLGFSF